MKKFTKGCLITALVLFLLGCGFWIVFGKIGGFKQLDQSGERVYDLGIGGLKFGYTGSGFGFGYWQENEGNKASGDLQVLTLSGEKVQTEYQAAEITEIEIEVGDSNLVVEPSEDEYIWIQNNNPDKVIEYGLEEGCFVLHTNRQGNSLHFSIAEGEQEKIYLYLPEGMQLQTLELDLEGSQVSSTALEADKLSITVDAGNLAAEGFRAQEMEISIGAGKAEITSLTAQKMSMEVGAGKAELHSLEAQDVVMEIGAGDLKVDEFLAETVELELDMGNLEAAGNFTESADVQCSMGNVTLLLQGQEKDYNYHVECAMGNVKVGESKWNGISAEHSVDNGSECFLNLECGMGNATIQFTE